MLTLLAILSSVEPDNLQLITITVRQKTNASKAVP